MKVPKCGRDAVLLPILCLCCLVSIAAAEDKAPAKDGKEAAPAAGAEPAAPPALEPGANLVCETDISFVWKPIPPPPKPGAIRGSNGPQVDKDEPVEQEPVEDFFTTAGEDGVVEEEVRNRLAGKIPQLQRQAIESCKILHENQTLCVSAKLRANFEQFNRLDFLSRKAMVEAISGDCEKKGGKCISAEYSPVKCHINRFPDVLPQKAEAPAPAAAGKDKKK